MIEWAKILGIISATFVSEDLTCISTGLLIRSGHLDALSGIGACTLGIFLGDLMLFFVGRGVAYGLFALPALRRRVPGGFARIERRFAREGWKLIVLARFVPGLRLPVYFGAGFLGGNARTMALVALGAGLIWTPLLVLLSVWIGPGLQEFIKGFVGGDWLALVLAIGLLYLSIRLLFSFLTQEGRRKLRLRIRRMSAVEFWPSIVFYAPLFPGWLYWNIRYLGFNTVTAVNPGMQNGGFVGESKAEILSQLPRKWALDWLLIPASSRVLRQKPQTDPLQQRLKFLQTKGVRRKGWAYPLILKPDQGQRGTGVRLIHTAKEARDYLAKVPDMEILAQVYHPGPHELGIFYYRLPDQKKGHIFSITDKIFPVLIGDGRSSIVELIWAHPRYSLQAETFIRRLERRKDSLDHVLKKKERFALAMAGNHVQGTMFRDGGHLYSEALRKSIDRLAQAMPEFYFGRFDIRYKDKQALKAGKGFSIIEVNGATSESTNIYDPRFSIFQVYKILYRQWQLLFKIAYQNRKRKMPYASAIELISMTRKYLKIQKASTLSD